MKGVTADVAALYRGRRNRVEVVDVPELGYVTVSGRGDPGGPEFTAAVEALRAVSHGARSVVRKAAGRAPRAMPLEALWWTDESPAQDILLALASYTVNIAQADAAGWCWRAMIMQPDPIDEVAFEAAVEQARKKPLPALDEVRYQRWTEGRCAQVLHVGPRAVDGPMTGRLHRALAVAGYQARGRHHEIYLSNPRRCTPERLRTLLRQPIDTA